VTGVLNFGSMNIDHVYRVDHLALPGETIACHDYRRFPGGKGLNQSIALAHAGARVWHAGRVGATDMWLATTLQDNKVDTRFIEAAEGPSGHAIIQVDRKGENSIVIFGGANRLISGEDATRVISEFEPGDYLLAQNEVSAVAPMMHSAKEKGMFVVFNPAPMTPEVLEYPLDLVDILVVNRTEAMGLCGENEPSAICDALNSRYPNASVVLTLGRDGATYSTPVLRIHQPALRVEAVDTTAAGDTFIGFFLAELIETGEPASALACGCSAAAVCVTRHGAADSIPWRGELPPADELPCLQVMT
jgi:ribokinase